jgi:cobalt-zinc-cadmium efflux system protein
MNSKKNKNNHTHGNHDHSHSHHGQGDHNHLFGHAHISGEDSTSKNLALAFFLNLAFSIIELIGGIYSNSVAILSDSLHDFGDALSLAAVWYMQKVSKRPIDENYSYGYKRYSLLGAVFISLILSIGSTFMLIESVKRLFNPQESNAEVMLYLAIFGIAVNGFAAFRLNKGSSFNERAVFLHFMEDVLGWIAVLVGSILMLIFEVPWFDPLISIGIAIWIFWNVYKNLSEVIRIFLQAVPSGFDLAEIQKKMESINGVHSTHDLHLWSLDGSNHIMSLHVVIDSDYTPIDIISLKKDIRQAAHSMRVTHTTIEFEASNELCESED